MVTSLRLGPNLGQPFSLDRYELGRVLHVTLTPPAASRDLSPIHQGDREGHRAAPWSGSVSARERPRHYLAMQVAAFSGVHSSSPV